MANAVADASTGAADHADQLLENFQQFLKDTKKKDMTADDIRRFENVYIREVRRGVRIYPCTLPRPPIPP